ncbi:MAG: phospho-N-acetylmuramoyl-pentapeptide-transferase [Actinobacteria bacterium]|nr:phospho-N-acetylmuramoyl-pentapeptide-transferase [Actinomycetota bacterium]
MIRLLLALALSLGVSLVGTRFLIQVLTARRIGQPIQEDLNQVQQEKAGTPTMGGLAIVASAAFAYVVSDLLLKFTARPGVFTYTGMFTMAAIIGAGIVGFLDDYIKVRRERNLGLSKRAKTIGLLLVAVAFSVAVVTKTAQNTTLSFTRWNVPGYELGKVGWVIFAGVLIYASTNAVNLTDGMDGLAGGAATLCFMAFVFIGFWSFRNESLYDTPHALDLAVIAACMLGACIGFLWWNAAPARIFMGDTGALAIGAALAGLALTLNTDLLLIIIGGLFVMETLSVIIQVASFRLFNGRRPFRMAPIHHHFELKGWPETTVIIRFWILAGLSVALALGIFYYDFIGTGALDKPLP